MGYRRADQILPEEIIALIQNYVDGECIYIPRKDGARRLWGERTGARREIRERDERIFSDYGCGISIRELAERYYLSDKSIERIIKNMKS